MLYLKLFEYKKMGKKLWVKILHVGPVSWPVEQLFQHLIRHVCRLQLNAGHSLWCCYRSGHKSLLTVVVSEQNFPPCASHRATLTLFPVSAWVEIYASLCKWAGHAAYRSIFLFQSSELNDWLKRKGNKRTSFSSCVCAHDVALDCSLSVCSTAGVVWQTVESGTNYTQKWTRISETFPIVISVVSWKRKSFMLSSKRSSTWLDLNEKEKEKNV